jgi:hypothetical protein
MERPTVELINQFGNLRANGDHGRVFLCFLTRRAVLAEVVVNCQRGLVDHAIGESSTKLAASMSSASRDASSGSIILAVTKANKRGFQFRILFRAFSLTETKRQRA